MKFVKFLLTLVLVFFAAAANAQCNPQYPATCAQGIHLYPPSYQVPQQRLYVPQPYRPVTPPASSGWQPRQNGTATFTDQYGNTLGYGYQSGNTTTYTDQYGNVLGRRQAQ